MSVVLKFLRMLGWGVAVFFENVGWAFGKITRKTATQRIGPMQRLTDVEVDYGKDHNGNAELRDLECLPSTYGFGDAVPVGSWVLFEPRRGLAEEVHGPDVEMEDAAQGGAPPAATAARAEANADELPIVMREAWRERLRLLCALHCRGPTSNTEVEFNRTSLKKLPAAELCFVAENITAGREAVPKTRSEVIARLMKRLEMHERDGQRLPAQRKQDRHAAKNRRVEKAAVDRRRQDARTDEQRHQTPYVAEERFLVGIQTLQREVSELRRGLSSARVFVVHACFIFAQERKRRRAFLTVVALHTVLLHARRFVRVRHWW